MASTKPQPQDLGPLATVPMAGNSGVPSTPAAGLGQVYGIGTSNLNLGFMNESGTAINVTGGLGAWQSWTPTFTNLTVGNGTLTCKYTQIGKTVHCRVSLTLGSTSSVSGDVSFTLPATAATYAGTGNITPIGTAQFFNTTLIYTGYVSMASTTNAIVRAFNTGASSNQTTLLSSTVPFTWASTHQLACSFTYEAA